jgi:UDP-N-acetylglucosamine 2-epimerase (non-hydrolysing)
MDPWPEEALRYTIDHWADLRLAPTPLALKALIDEGLEQGSVLIGNTVVDALRALELHPVPMPIRAPVVIVTLHRRESWGVTLDALVDGVKAVALETENRHGLVFRWPAHLAPAVQASAQRLKEWTRKWKTAGNFRVEEPWPYTRFARTLAYARAVVTDSGGVVEEAATLGVPCVIARDRTERMEAVNSGQALLAGRTAEGVATALRQCLSGVISSRPSQVFGDGYASVAACDAIERMFSQP